MFLNKGVDDMKIVVCIKQVPDTNEVRIDPVTGTLIREGVPSIINPDDKNALEEALRLKDEMGAYVTVLTMGPPQAESALREALAMGADEAVLLTDRAFGGADTWATSLTLAKALEKIGYDVIFAGRQAIDGDTAQVGPEMAEHLNIPQVTYVERVNIEGNELKVRRALEDGYETIKVGMPCLLTAIKELNKPRYMNMGGIFTCFKKEIKKMTADDLDIDKSELRLSGSPTRVRQSFTKGPKTPGEKLDTTPLESAEIITLRLKERHLI
jgi:electron transfer flavoprotein beta subunit